MSCTKHMTDGACSDCKIEQLEKELEITSQARTVYRIGLQSMEAENEKLKKELEEVRYCAEWYRYELGLASEYKKSLDDLKASLPKIKADAVRAFDIPELDSVGDERVVSDALNEHANKLEAGE